MELAQGISLATMSPVDCDRMNTGFAAIASSHHLAERMIQMLLNQKGLSIGCQIDLCEHGLQTATRCYHDLLKATQELADPPENLTDAGLTPEDEELVVVALLHDVGETLSPINHGEIAASLLRPHISPQNWWILMHLSLIHI
eukprot:TRINITY_DN1496_c0_g2_i2.p2 TRINITY_DN1496_c0_g2~~TRINITY_DN1496_c0_g2_i2.p2  ORF type:complete len:143 (+),score=40.20 TRINITY_DN1496_c0_g2_i2:192-620(+)